MYPIIIQLTGAQSSGKTTLVQALKDRLRPGSVTTVGETSRTLKSAGAISQLDIKAVPYEQLIINNEYMLRYLAAITSGCPIVLAERSTVCCLAYAMTMQSDFVMESTWRMHHLLHKLPGSVYRFYLPSILPLEDDGVRNMQSQVLIDNNIRHICFTNVISVRTIGELSVTDRVEHILSHIRPEVEPWLI